MISEQERLPRLLRRRIVALALFLIGAALWCILTGLSAGVGARLALIFGSTAISMATVVVDFVLHRRQGLRWVRPRVIAVGYLVYALLVPQIYIAVTGSGIGSIPASTLTSPVAAIMCGMILLVIGGTWAADLLPSPRPATIASRALTAFRDPRLSPTLLAVGRVLLLVSLAARIIQVIVEGSVFTSQYGANQTQYTDTTAIAVIGESLIPVASLMVMAANTIRHRRPLTATDGVLLGCILVISMVLLGSRTELIAPALMFIWFWLRSGRRIPSLVVIAGLVVVAVGFVGIWDLRGSAGRAYPPFEELLWQTSSPQLLTAEVVSRVPSEHGFYWGATYLAAIPYLLPGALARAIFGGDLSTGAYVYRELIHFTDPNQGFGFALPTEAYLNFGIPGVLLIGFGIGLGFGVAYAHGSRGRIASIGSLIYPLILGSLPYALRSDALTQTKMVLYPVIILAVTLYVIAPTVSRLTQRALRRRTSVTVERPR